MSGTGVTYGGKDVKRGQNRTKELREEKGERRKIKEIYLIYPFLMLTSGLCLCVYVESLITFTFIDIHIFVKPFH